MALILFFVFILLPIAELYVIIQVGQAIGLVPTLALLIIDGVIGAALARSQGRAAWLRFNQAMAAGRVPAREVIDGALIVFGGALLLSPGFITDLLGLVLLLPPTRAILRAMLKRAAAKTPTGRPVFFVYDRARGSARPPRGPGSPPPGFPPQGAPTRRRPGGTYDVEGTAREIDDDPPELDPGERR
jgi:UPF0716 protein FxsA